MLQAVLFREIKDGFFDYAPRYLTAVTTVLFMKKAAVTNTAATITTKLIIIQIPSKGCVEARWALAGVALLESSNAAKSPDLPPCRPPTGATGATGTSALRLAGTGGTACNAREDADDDAFVLGDSDGAATTDVATRGLARLGWLAAISCADTLPDGATMRGCTLASKLQPHISQLVAVRAFDELHIGQRFFIGR